MSTRPALPFDHRQDRLALAAWSRVAEPGDALAAALIERFGPGQGLLVALGGQDGAHVRFRARADQVDPRPGLTVLRRLGGRLVCPTDAEWPPGLADLPVPPICLWVLGPLRLGPACERSVSIVGSRDSSPYGVEVTDQLSEGCVSRGFTVVSGAAYGIDGVAHRAALASGGSTIAVVAGGVDRAYPREHEDLLARIARVGAVVSEVPPGSAPTRIRFIQRNRMIAAMTRGTVVVEAAHRSGALNTARTAADLGRPVGVVPGPVTSPRSAGCHQALRDGFAVAVTDAGEVADLVGRLGQDAAARPVGARRPDWDDLDPVCRGVLEALPRARGSGVDKLAGVAALPADTVRAALGQLTLLGLAERQGSGWRRVPGPAGSGGA